MNESEFEYEVRESITLGKVNKILDFEGEAIDGVPYSGLMVRFLSYIRHNRGNAVRFNPNPRPVELKFWVCANPLCNRFVPDLEGKLPDNWRNIVIKEYKWADGLNGDISFVLCDKCGLHDVLDQLSLSGIGVDE